MPTPAVPPRPARRTIPAGSTTPPPPAKPPSRSAAATFTVAVENAEPALRDTLYARFKETSGVFAGYEEKTDRTFPVLILRPIMEAA